VELVTSYFNIGFNLAALAIGLKIMFDCWSICGRLDEITQLLAELREEKADRVAAGKFVRQEGSEADP
jgi:hypothetical protein